MTYYLNCDSMRPLHSRLADPTLPVWLRYLVVAKCISLSDSLFQVRGKLSILEVFCSALLGNDGFH